MNQANMFVTTSPLTRQPGIHDTCTPASLAQFIPGSWVKFGLGLLLIMASSIGHALEFECNQTNDKRFIRVDLPGYEHLCEVSVTYPSSERKVMWYADHDTLFCSAKAYELRKKYEDTWSFECTQWPDRDGVDQLSERQRSVLDRELKNLILEGQSADSPFSVSAIKAVASSFENENPSMLAVQFFLTNDAGQEESDVTLVLRDDGSQWNTVSRIDTLASHVDADDADVDAAYITSVSPSGALDVSTLIKTEDESGTCYGNLVLQAADSGDSPVARTPHRFVCVDSDAG